MMQNPEYFFLCVIRYLKLHSEIISSVNPVKLVIPKMLKMGVVPACIVLAMKWGPRNITGGPGVSIM